MAKNRKWIISWNNYPPTLTLEELKEKIINFAKVEYLILAFEKGEEKETPHIQGYVRFNNPQHFKSFQKLFNNSNGTFGYIDQAKGNDLQNANYCRKQNKYIEYGIIEEKEEDIIEIKNIIDDITQNMPYKDLCQKYWKYVLYHYKDFKALYFDLRGLKDKENFVDEQEKWIKEKNGQ